MAAVARRAHHLPHGLQEPLRRAGPLGGQLRRAGALRAGADRPLGGPGGASRPNLPKVPTGPHETTGGPMPINVTPIAGLSDHINDIRLRTARIVNEKILPNESLLWHARGSNVTEAERAEAKALRHEIQEQGEGRGAVGAPPPARVRRHGHRLHGARLHERDPRLRRRRGLPVRRGGAQLGQPDDPGQVRDGGAEAEVAPPARRGDDAVGLLHDGARERRLRPAVHSDHAPSARATSG